MSNNDESYDLQSEAKDILLNRLITDSRLNVPESVKKCAQRTNFVTENVQRKPFIPAPLKMTESSTALWAFLGAFGNAIAEARYGVKDQECNVNSDRASLYLLAAVVATLGGKSIRDPELAPRLLAYDKGNMSQVYRRMCTTIYQTKDSRYFHLHGSLNSTPSLTMLGLPLSQPDLDFDQSVKIYNDEVSKHDSRWLDVTANERYRQAGTICYTPEEFLETAQGKAIKDEPIYSTTKEHEGLPAVSWPEVSDKSSKRPLDGIKILDLSRIIAAPAISRICAALGATILRLSSSSQPDMGVLLLDGNLGKHDAYIDLKTEEGKQQFEKLLEDADVVLEAYRPGSLARMGFSPEYIHEVAKRRGKGIVHIRENCYGWKGPWAHRSGWQQISDCVTGASWLQGKFLGLNEPVTPPIPNSDYQVGLCGAAGIMDALLRRSIEGGSYSVDVSLNQFNLFYLSLGELPKNVQDRLQEEHKNIGLRHYDDMFSGVGKVSASLSAVVPEVLTTKENYSFAKANWGVEGEIMTYAKPAIEYTESVVQFKMGSSKPGSHNPEWPQE